jgi:hypothetical protein
VDQPGGHILLFTILINGKWTKPKIFNNDIYIYIYIYIHLPEKVLDKYFEIKGVLNLITCSMGFFLGGEGVELLSDFFNFSIL